jgi:anthranilate phosphoribosyltransferase
LNRSTAPPGQFAPVVIPTYNGARKMANLTLLAMLLAREGVPVLVHGVATDLGRVATAEVFAALGVPAARHRSEAEEAMSQRKPAFITIETMAPKLAYLLSLRRKLGVRNSTHTLVKIMQPFAGRRCGWCRTPTRNTWKCWASTSPPPRRMSAAMPS